MAAIRKMPKNVQKLIHERDRLRAELATLTGKIAGIETAISLMLDDEDQASPADGGKSGRGEAKTLLLALLEETGATGLNASIAEDMAKRRGVTLKRGTAASNLSRLKADGVVVHDKDRYRLPKFVRQPGLAIVSGTIS